MLEGYYPVWSILCGCPDICGSSFCDGRGVCACAGCLPKIVVIGVVCARVLVVCQR